MEPVRDSAAAEYSALHSGLNGAVQSALIHDGDLGVLDVESFEGFQNGLLDLAAVLVHNAAGQGKFNARAGLYSDHRVAGFECARRGRLPNFHGETLLPFIEIV